MQRHLNDTSNTSTIKRAIVTTLLAITFFSIGDAVLSEAHAADPIPQPTGPWYR